MNPKDNTVHCPDDCCADRPMRWAMWSAFGTALILIGIYLAYHKPLSSTQPLAIGGMVSEVTK